MLRPNPIRPTQAELESRAGLARAVAGTLLLILLVGALAWFGLAQIFSRHWPWEIAGSEPSQSDIFKLALGMVAAAGAAIALVVNYRRQRHLEVDYAGQRDHLRLLTERFGAAAAQLGGEQAAVRLAGVFAMAALADEWSERRQQCIDVLCGYLRLPYVGEPPPGHPELIVEQQTSADGTRQRTATTSYRPGEVQVRHAIVNTIAQHLQTDAPISWSRLDFNFDGATLVNAAFHGAKFAGDRTSFHGTTFAGARTTFNRAVFSGKSVWFIKAVFVADDTDFTDADFNARSRVWFAGATFRGNCSFEGARFATPTTSFHVTTFSGAETTFDHASFEGTATFDGALFESARTTFQETVFGSARLDSCDHPLASAHFSEPRLVAWGDPPAPPRWQPSTARSADEIRSLSGGLFWPSERPPPSPADAIGAR
jgi:uncharacterized protein YjbI with pentapeptide repeats